MKYLSYSDMFGALSLGKSISSNRLFSRLAVRGNEWEDVQLLNAAHFSFPICNSADVLRARKV